MGASVLSHRVWNKCNGQVTSFAHVGFLVRPLSGFLIHFIVLNCGLQSKYGGYGCAAVGWLRDLHCQCYFCTPSLSFFTSFLFGVHLCVDLEVLECLLRPHIVKAYTLTIPDVGVAHEVLEGWVIGDNAAMVTGEPEEGCEVPPGSGMFSPSLGSYSMWTTQPTNKIPGHTGYLTMATLY